MRKDFFFIIILILGLVSLAGCRAQRSVKASESRTRLDEIGVELHRVDSLWSTLAEKFRLRIEYYEPNEQNNLTENPESGSRPAAPCSTMPAASSGPSTSKVVGSGGMGAVKSVEFTVERTEDRSSITATDSVMEQKSASQVTLQEDKTTVARQDNGTWTIVSIVAAAALLIFLFVKFHRR